MEEPLLYGSLILNTDALVVFLQAAFVASCMVIACMLLSVLAIHVAFSFFFAFFAIICDGKDLLLFRDIEDYKGNTDWLVVYMGISIWTWIVIIIGITITTAIKYLFEYGVLRFQ